MSSRTLWICIAIGLLSGCVESTPIWIGGEGPIVVLHGGRGAIYEPWDGTLQQIMRVRANADVTDTEDATEDLVDDEGHRIFCDSARADGWCCVHDAPEGATSVCLRAAGSQ